MEPFTPEGASVFNRFFEDDLLNAFLGGALVLLILTNLSSISVSLLYPTRSLRKRAIDRYIIFSRISSFRGLLRLFSGTEWPRRVISTTPSHDNHFAEKGNIPHVHREYSRLLLPCAMRILLLAAELGAIYAGTTLTQFATTEEGFDVTIPLVTSALDTSKVNGTGCDNYLVPARGQEQAGEVLKCVFRTSEQTTTFVPSDENTSIALIFTPSQNSLIFELRSTELRITRIELQVILNSINGNSFQLGPIRPDLDLTRSTAVFDTIIDALLGELQLARSGSRSVEESSIDIHIDYSQEMPFEQLTVADALVPQLRALPLSTNSTGPPWVFIDGGYEQRDEIRIAIIGLNRVAHGILLAVAIALALIHAIVQHFMPAFTEVAYAASKSYTRDSIGVGPAARSVLPAEDGSSVRMLRLQKFSDGETGHIGFRASNPNQIPVESFEGCEVVL